MSDFSTFELDVEFLENELRQQLSLIDDDVSTSGRVRGRSLAQSSLSNHHKSFEMAQIEGEKEELLDQLESLSSRCEEIEAINKLLLNEKRILKEENDSLKSKFNTPVSNDLDSVTIKPDQVATDNGDLNAKYQIAQVALMQLQSEVSALQECKENYERELIYQKTLRAQAEKERDAYETAYQDSLRHFSRWTKSKLQTISSPDLDIKSPTTLSTR